MKFNDAILSSVAELNQFSGKGYKWDNSLDGSIGDVLYQDKVILKGNPDDFTYCCGLTLQTYLMACVQMEKYLGTAEDVMKIRRTWFIADSKPGPIYENKGPADALVPWGHGLEVTIDEAIPGDLVQFWRKSGSGHSVIFIATFTENGVRGLKYWSTQTATNGIGYRTEYFDGVQNPITHVHICRPI